MEDTALELTKFVVVHEVWEHNVESIVRTVSCVELTLIRTMNPRRNLTKPMKTLLLWTADSGNARYDLRVYGDCTAVVTQSTQVGNSSDSPRQHPKLKIERLTKYIYADRGHKIENCAQDFECVF
jgi:hypothetical protein